MIELAVAFLTQIGVLGAAIVAARAAGGARIAAKSAKAEATGAKTAAEDAAAVGVVDHAEHTGRLEAISRGLADIRRDVGGMREDQRQSRRELHDLRLTLTKHLEEDK